MVENPTFLISWFLECVSVSPTRSHSNFTLKFHCPSNSKKEKLTERKLLSHKRTQWPTLWTVWLLGEKWSLSAPFLSRWPPNVTITNSQGFIEGCWKGKNPTNFNSVTVLRTSLISLCFPWMIHDAVGTRNWNFTGYCSFAEKESLRRR